MKRVSHDRVYTRNRSYLLPDRRIVEQHRSHVYVPLKGYSGHLAVFNDEDKPIGWMDTRDLGYETVKDWMKEERWIDQGY